MNKLQNVHKSLVSLQKLNTIRGIGTRQGFCALTPKILTYVQVADAISTLKYSLCYFVVKRTADHGNTTIHIALMSKHILIGIFGIDSWNDRVTRI